ncbi:glycosyltransferase [Candidatus Saccharibacteria bacterium]|nr:glycosyltransferase [Candidatus Saccharibacteria bacterium]
MSKLKIAVFTDVFLDVTGGIPSSIQAQKDILERIGYEVTIFCPGTKQPKDKSIVTVPTMKFLRINGAPTSRGPKKVEKFITEKFPSFAQFDVVHVHYEASCSIAGARLARAFGVPLVQTMHGREDMAIALNVPHPFKTIAATVLNFLHSRYIPHETIVSRDNHLAPTIARAKMWTLMVNQANFADQVLVPSKHFEDKLKHYGVKKPVMVVSNGVSDELIARFDKIAKERGVSELRSMKDGEPLKLIWNSRVSHEKRIMPFLKAIRKMSRPVKISIYGDGNALAAAKRYVELKGLSDRVKFYGAVEHDKILEKMLSQHMSVMTSYGFDTQGLTLLEAEATGLPVFFVDPDMREVVPRAGSVKAGKSPSEMAKKLDWVSYHPESIAAMSREMLLCRGEIFQSTQIQKLISLYERMAAGRASV